MSAHTLTEGTPISATDGRGNTSITHYDSNGRVDWTADAANATNSFLYDALGRRVTTIDPLGQETHTGYDIEGRVTNVWGATYPVQYEYDAFGRMTALKTFRQEGGTPDATRWYYDLATGLLTNKLYADGKGTAYSYTPDGRLATRTWARGVVTTYAYDTCCGALTNILYSDSTPTVSYQYDRLGRQKTITDVLGTRTNSYDTTTLVLTSERLPDGTVLSRTQDTLGRSTGIAASPDYDVGYGYDEVGRFAGLVATNAGVAVADVRYGYVPGTYLLSGWTNSVSETTVIRNYESNRDLLTRVRNLGGQKVISQFDYQNDALGRRAQRLDTLAGIPNSLTNSFGYNARSEVIAALMGTNEYGYAFDPIGNRLVSTNSGESFSYTANELNQYLQVVDGGTFNLGYDLDGNLTNDGQRVYFWDAENRLLAVEPLAPTGGARRIRCAYDHMSRRIEKAVDVWNGSDWVANATNRFIWDGWLLVGEYGQQATGVTTNWNVWGLDLSGSLQGAGGIGGLICRTAGDGAIHHYFMDANGNVSDITDASGTNILARYLPGPFGEPRLVGGTLDSNPWQFSTKYWDSETGLGYWGYRYYDPITGRWLSRDPIGERGGWCLYGFAENAPLGRYDRLGLSWLVCDKCEQGRVRFAGPDGYTLVSVANPGFPNAVSAANSALARSDLLNHVMKFANVAAGVAVEAVVAEVAKAIADWGIEANMTWKWTDDMSAEVEAIKKKLGEASGVNIAVKVKWQKCETTFTPGLKLFTTRLDWVDKTEWYTYEASPARDGSLLPGSFDPNDTSAIMKELPAAFIEAVREVVK